MPRLQGLVFDLDGTLLDSAPDLRHAVNLTLQAHGRRALTLDEIKGLTGDGMLPMLHRAFAATGTPLPDNADGVSGGRYQAWFVHQQTGSSDTAVA